MKFGSADFLMLIKLGLAATFGPYWFDGLVIRQLSVLTPYLITTQYLLYNTLPYPLITTS